MRRSSLLKCCRGCHAEERAENRPDHRKDISRTSRSARPPGQGIAEAAMQRCLILGGCSKALSNANRQIKTDCYQTLPSAGACMQHVSLRPMLNGHPHPLYPPTLC